MKKTVIALAAAAAASGAFAQVVLSGNLDIAAVSSTGTLAGANGTTFQSTTGTSSTTAINISATEDLGGGMKAMAFFGLDPRTLSNDSYSANITNNPGGTQSSSTAINNQTITGLARHEAYVGLSGGFGTVALGSKNAASLDLNAASSPLGTGIGSAYTANGAAGTMWNSTWSTRSSRSLKYESPVMNGLSVNVTYAPGNDQLAAAMTSLHTIPNNRQFTDASLKYSAGKLNVVLAIAQQGAQTNPTGFYPGIGSASLASTQASGIAANYNFGPATLYAAGFNGNTLKASATAQNVTGSRFGVKANMGKVDLMAQYTEVSINNSGSASTVGKVTGLRADYNLSKTAAAYFGAEQYDSGAATANQQTLTSIGIRKSF